MCGSHEDPNRRCRGEAIEAVGVAGGQIEPVVPGAESDRSGVSATLADGSLEVSTDPSEGLSVEGPEGIEVGLAISGADGPDGAVEHGSVVYEDVARSTSVVARPTQQGAQALIVIDRSDAPSTFTFPIDANGGAVTLRPTEDGSIEVMSGQRKHPVATVAPPWATDANGDPVPTHFEVQGSFLIQVVDHVGATYPVIADPKYTWGYVTGTTYYNRKETRSLKTRSYAYVVAAGICAALGPQSAGAACVAAGAFAAQWNYVAANAYGDGKCVKIKVPTFWASAYSGGYCK